MVRHPELPDWLEFVDMRGVRLGEQWAHLLFERTPSGTALIMKADVNLDARVAN